MQILRMLISFHLQLFGLRPYSEITEISVKHARQCYCKFSPCDYFSFAVFWTASIFTNQCQTCTAMLLQIFPHVIVFHLQRFGLRPFSQISVKHRQFRHVDENEGSKCR